MAVDPQIRYDIPANAGGTADVRQLTAELEKLDGSIDPALAARVRETADALRSLGEQRDAIAEFVALKSATQQARQQLEQAQAAAQKMGAELANVAEPTRVQASRMENLRDAVQVAKREVQDQSRALDQSRASLQRAGVATDQLSDAERGHRATLQAAQTQVRELVVWQEKATRAAQQAETQARALAQQYQATDRATDQLRADSGSLADSLGGMAGHTAAAGDAVAGITVMVGNAAKASAAFGHKMAEVGTQLDDNAGLDGLSEQVRALSVELGGDVIQNAQGLYDILLSGVDDAGEAMDRLTVANKLAVGGVTDVTTAAGGLNAVMNSFGVSAGSATDVADSFFIAAKAGATSVGELSTHIGTVAPLAAQAGASFDELIAAAAALTNGGVSTSQALTQVQGILAAVVTPTKEAAQLADELGLQFNVAALQSQGLAGFLQDLHTKTGGNAEQMALLFGQVDGLNGALALTGNQAGSFAGTLEQLRNKAGATEEAFTTLSDTPAARAQQFQSALGDLQLSLGDAVTSLAPLLGGMTELLHRFNGLGSDTKAVIAGLGATAWAAGPLVQAFNQLVQAARAFQGLLGAAGLAGGLGGLTATAATTVPALGSVSRELDIAEASARRGMDSMGRLSTVMRVAGWAGVAIEVAQVASGLYQLKEATAAAAAAQREASTSQAVTEQKITAALNANSAAAQQQILSREQLAQMSETEQQAYQQSLQQGADFWNARAVQQRRAGEDTTESNRRQQEYLTALAAMPGMLAQIQETQSAQANEASGAWGRQQIAAGALATQLEAAANSGDKASGAIQNLITKESLLAPNGAATLAAAMQMLNASGSQAAQVIGTQLTAALATLSAGELTTVQRNLQVAFDGGRLSAEQFALVNNQVVAASLAKLGLDAQQVLTGISSKASEAIQTFDLLAASGELSGSKLALVFDAALRSADSEQAIDALRDRLVQMGVQGTLSADQVRIGMQQLQVATQQVRGATDETTGAFARLGIQSKAELLAMSTQMRTDLQTAVRSGQVSVGELEGAFNTAYQTAIKAGDGFSKSWIELQAPVYGIKLRLNEVEASAGQAGDAGRNAGDKLAEGMDEARAAIEAADEAYGRASWRNADGSLKPDAGGTSGKGEAAAPGSSDMRTAGTQWYATRIQAAAALKSAGHDEDAISRVIRIAYNSDGTPNLNIVPKNSWESFSTSLLKLLDKELYGGAKSGGDGIRLLKNTPSNGAQSGDDDTPQRQSTPSSDAASDGSPAVSTQAIPSPRSAPTPKASAPEATQVFRVEVVRDGRGNGFNVASAADALAAQSLLKQLAEDAARAF
ncbi:phage tail tape measure protein [Chitiniphilus eburneus]|uniref:Phage tail tape measure protein n=1 Tax=Chitiniphilus eburneus TaxID=2571148 RepID=A0A4V5MQM9_9NEIS|nr:phage tail tape measure protein [Chitiniphilus eburneus]TJZ73188.1 phage tail tape measure protein [Chitiniphilus eburneus]